MRRKKKHSKTGDKRHAGFKKSLHELVIDNILRQITKLNF